MAAQERVRSQKHALQRIGYRPRWVDALNDFPVASPFLLFKLALRSQQSEYERDIERVDAREAARDA